MEKTVALPDALHVDLCQALLKERVLFLDKIEQICSWADNRCQELCRVEAGTFQELKESQLAREFKETAVETEVGGALAGKRVQGNGGGQGGRGR